MALKNFTQFTPQTLLSATDFMVGYRQLDEIRTDLDSMSLGVSALLISKGFLPGTSVGRIKRVGFVYTIGSSSNLNAVSGTDDNGLTLSYTPDQIEVYRNGSHLANILDFTATNSTQVTNLSTLNLGDVVEVVALSGVGATILLALSGITNSLVQKNYRYSVASGNTIAPAATLISGSDDYNSVLNFNINSFQVYLNGSHLVRDYDYTSYNSGTAFTLASPVADGDAVDVISLSSVFITSLSSLSAFSGINKILAGDRIAISSSTGNVTVSSQTCISDILVPSWTNANHISQFSLLQNYLSAVATTNTSPASASYVEQYGSFPGAQGYWSGVLAPNGKIYFIPRDAGVGRVVDPTDNSVITYGSFGSVAYQGGVLAPNGKIYFAPANAVVGALVDPSDNSVTTYGSFPGGNAYAGSVLAPNGKIYFVPYSAAAGAIVDPSSNGGTSVQFYGSFPGSGAYIGGVLAPNGKIYFVPQNAGVGRIVDPTDNSVTTYGSFGAAAYAGGVLAPNGKIYFVPNNATVGAIVDPSSNGGTSVQFYGTFLGSDNYWGGVLTPNGKIYFVPYNATVGRFVDPANNSVTTYGSFGGSGAYVGGVLAPNGKIYFVPHYATVGAAVNTLNNNNWNLNVCTNPFFNKF